MSRSIAASPCFRVPRLRFWHWFVLVALIALDVVAMKSEGWLFHFHPVIQHFVTLLPAIAIPLAHRHQLTHPHTGVLLISLAALMAGGGPHLTGQGEYHPGAPWHTLFTSISGCQALIVPTIVTSMLTILGVRLSKKRLRYRADLRERRRVTQELIDQPHSSDQGQVAEAVVDNTLAPPPPMLKHPENPRPILPAQKLSIF